MKAIYTLVMGEIPKKNDFIHFRMNMYKFKVEIYGFE